MTLDEYLKRKQKEIDTMTLKQARDVIASTLSHYDMQSEFEKAVKMLLDCADEVLEQEPRKGHWIKEKSIHGWDGHSYQCSVCGRSIHLDTAVEDLADYPYCHCGADLREVEQEPILDKPHIKGDYYDGFKNGLRTAEWRNDKIRAEIEEHCGLTKENHCRYCSYCNNLMGIREILEIIDKYKGESEDT